jgi:hypothetical protein
MTFFSSFFAGPNPARSKRRVEARRAAKGARFAAIRSFQDSLKRAEETDGVQPPVKTPATAAGEPTRDTQGRPSTNPHGDEASKAGPALRQNAKPPEPLQMRAVVTTRDFALKENPTK